MGYNNINTLVEKLNRLQTSMTTKSAKPKAVRLLINQNALTNEFTVQAVNTKCTPIDVNPRDYAGPLGMILNAIERYNDIADSFFQFGDATPNLNISEHPEMMYLLQRCQELLLDQDGKPIRFSEEAVQPYMSINQAPEGQLLTLVYIQPGEEKTTMKPITDSFVLGGDNIIYPVNTLGDNYLQLNSFNASFIAEEELEDYLSIFYSYIHNVLLDGDPYRLSANEGTIEAVPTLCFERVDADKALFLRVMNSMPNIGNDASSQLTEQMQLSVRAVVGIDKSVTLMQIQRRPLDESKAILGKILNECAPSRQARKAIYEEDSFFIVPEESAGPFLFNALPQLLKNFALLGAEKLREYKVSPAQPKLNISLSSGIDFLEGDASVEIGSDTMTLAEMLNAWRKQHYIILSDGNRALIAEDYMRRLERIFDTSKKKDGKIRISFFDLPEMEDLLQERLEGEVFERHRKVYLGFNELKDKKLPTPHVNATLRDYQREGVKWIKYLYDNNLGGCLADDMGLGKTLQAITVLADIYSKKKAKQRPTLIVMPRSLIFNWQNEIQKFAPQLTTYTYYGTERKLDDAMKAQVILTTYAVVRNDIENLKDIHFLYVILDESQNIKNVTSQSAQAVHLLHTDHRLALSGTPVENNLTELYSLFRFLNPAMFGTLDSFNQRYTNPIQKDGDKMVLNSLRRKIFPFLLRRLKKDVLKELPDRIDQTLHVEMSEKQHRLYDERRRYYKTLISSNIKAEGIKKSQFVMFQALNELRQIASIPENFSDGKIASPKTDQLIDSLTEAVENGHKVVVFFNFLTGIELVAERLTQLGIGYVEMTGATANRKKVVDTFQKSPSCMVMLMTLKTGGVGLNLTAADTVFIFEPWWNKAAEEQAINRLHRMGQTQKVLSYSIIAKGTIEEKILLLQQQKAELFEGLIGNDSSSAKVLTEEDINFILG